METLIVDHNAGLFSCFSQRLGSIVCYANKYKKFPELVDSSQQFSLYKPLIYSNQDISNFFIKNKKYEIEYKSNIFWEDQFTDYSKINFNLFNLIINEYFELSDGVKQRIKFFEKIYNIKYNNLCSVLYRGNDKHKECLLATHDDFILKMIEIKKEFSNISFFIQTDDFLFLEKCKNNFELIFIKEVPTINNPDTSVTFTISQDLRLEFAIDLIAAVNIASKCKILITHSGNCGYWAALYRGYSSGLVQHFTNEKGNNYGWILN